MQPGLEPGSGLDSSHLSAAEGKPLMELSCDGQIVFNAPSTGSTGASTAQGSTVPPPQPFIEAPTTSTGVGMPDQQGVAMMQGPMQQGIGSYKYPPVAPVSDASGISVQEPPPDRGDQSVGDTGQDEEVQAVRPTHGAGYAPFATDVHKT